MLNLYDIAMAFLTDNDTTFIESADKINLIKTIPGHSYLLTIYTPTDGLSQLINSGESTPHPENNHALKKGPYGTITLYCNGRLVQQYTTQTPVAPRVAEYDNFIRRFIRQFREKEFFNLINWTKYRKQNKIVLHNNSETFKNLLFNQKSQKQL